MRAIEVTAAEDGGSIEADVGDTILLRLSDNPTTGYRWELQPVAGECVSLGNSGYESSGDSIGGGGVATWTLHAAAAGTVSIRAKRWRPWAGEASVLARLAVTVHVH